MYVDRSLVASMENPAAVDNATAEKTNLKDGGCDAVCRPRTGLGILNKSTGSVEEQSKLHPIFTVAARPWTRYIVVYITIARTLRRPLTTGLKICLFFNQQIRGESAVPATKKQPG